MGVKYTQAITVDTDGVFIKSGTDYDIGEIPTDIKVYDVTVYPDTDSLDYYVKGTHAQSEWIQVRDSDPWTIDGSGGTSTHFFYVKAAADSFTLNIVVKGS